MWDFIVIFDLKRKFVFQFTTLCVELSSRLLMMAGASLHEQQLTAGFHRQDTHAVLTCSKLVVDTRVRSTV